MRKLVIGSDKGGFPLKEHIKKHLLGKGHEVKDVGTLDPENPVFFFETAPNVARAIQRGEAEMGILCCNTGMGMSQVANKFHGIFAACCESVYSATRSREVNNSNILCMGTWIVAPEMGVAMTEAFLGTEFTQGLPEERADYLRSLREKVLKIDDSTRK